MRDPRMEALARLIVDYSVEVQPGQNVLIDATGVPADMVCLLVDEVRRAGGAPFVELGDTQVRRALFRQATPEQLDVLCRRDLAFMKEMQGYVALRGSANTAEFADVSAEQMKRVSEHWLRPVTDQRVNHANWVVLRWPTPAMAQLAGMSTQAFEDFYFTVCTLDYGRMEQAQEPLVKRLLAADQVHIRGPRETNLTFSVKGIPAVPCCGRRNLPDGEVYTAPVRDSVNGVIHYNVPTSYHGKSFDDVCLRFCDGRIVEATASDTPALNAILDSDPGARYIGEFAFGLNPGIAKPMRDILFDEKIAGSIHLTPGNAYERADNGNRSQVHWDLILVQTPEHGGGEIHIDGELIRRDGRFVPADLQGLNPEALMASK